MDGQLNEGQGFGDYDVLSVVGVGGMGIVYRARQRSLGRVVALKVIRPDVADDADFRARFLREARLAASVDHPHVVTVHDAGQVEGRLFLSMQWVDGQDLQQILRYAQRLEPERAARVVSQLAGALDAVHAVGLVHRDVKPANVLIRRIGDLDHAYLTDFGVARPTDADGGLTRSGAVVGTAGYMAPEQIRGAEPSPTSDLYALGCLFFEAVAGVPPFKADNELALRWAHANDPRPLLSAALSSGDTRFDDFIETAMAKDPADRFTSGRTFARALSSAYEAGATGAETATAVTASASAGDDGHPRTAIAPATPLPDGSQPSGAGAGPYGYVTPSPPGGERRRSGSPVALIILAVVAVVGIAAGALAASGVFKHGSATKTITKPAAVKTPTTVKAKATPGHTAARPTATASSSASNSPGAAVPAGLTPCGGDVSVLSPHTSCPFGRSVEQAYLQSSGGTTDVTASSPVTGQTYTMHCTGGSPHICTGGNDAEVAFTASPALNSGSAAGTPGCNPNITYDTSTTSCGFAKNVFIAYWNAWQQNGDQSDMQVTAHSEATGQDYTMNCPSDGTTVTCTGGNNASVSFPLAAIRKYTGP